jgi:hypothetical protein
VLYTPKQIHGVPAAASGPAVPDASADVDSEGSGVVAAVQRTGADQLIAVALEALKQAVGFQDLIDTYPKL